MRRVLVVNADDLGLSPGVNRGILLAHRRGIVTSASLMVGRPATGAAVEAAREHPALSLGLHLDLGEWAWDGGGWTRVGGAVDLDDEEAVGREVDGQIARFRLLVGRDPTHLDSHQHVHRDGAAAAVVAERGRRLGVPVRWHTPDVRHEGGFHGQTGRGEPYPEGIALATLLRLVASLPPGITELGCHPGGVDAPGAYAAERARETRVLCHPAVASAIRRERVALVSFAHVPGAPACA